MKKQPEPEWLRIARRIDEEDRAILEQLKQGKQPIAQPSTHAPPTSNTQASESHSDWHGVQDLAANAQGNVPSDNTDIRKTGRSQAPANLAFFCD